MLAGYKVKDGEIVALVDLSEHPQGMVVNQTMQMESICFLVTDINGEWRLANLSGDHVPELGWPPDGKTG